MDSREQAADVKNKLVFLLLLVALFIFSCYTIASMTLTPKYSRHPHHYHYVSTPNKLASNLTSSSCKIPEFNPFSEEIAPAIAESMTPLSCPTYERQRYPLLFNSSVIPVPHLVPVASEEEIEKLQIFNCTYKLISRKPSNSLTVDEVLSVGETKEYPVSLSENTEIPMDHNLIVVLCWRMVTEPSIEPVLTTKIVQLPMDVHAFPVLNETGPKYSKNNYNVIVLGIDSTSRLNFMRAMPKTREYLLETLEALEMTAYHKIGDNTFPNVGPMLTNQKPINESILPCEKNKFYDDCPFIWKDFEKVGYKTLFGEDERSLSIFNLDKHGYKLPPTSFYMRPLTIGADLLTGHHKKKFTHFCFGPRPAIEVALDFMQKISYICNAPEKKHNYFQFFWSTSTTHDYINGAQLLDGPFVEALKWWNEGGYLRNTILIVMSDHGARFGKVHQYYQGLIEDRLPAMYVYLPPRFKQAHPVEYRNLANNQNRLMTSVDLHKTLKHVLQFRKKNMKILGEEEKKGNGSEYYQSGISLFTPIPLNRTCAEAGIKEAYCTCNHKMVPVDETDLMVGQAANYAVYVINNKFKVTTSCAYLKLDRVVRAGIVSFGEGVKGVDIWVGYQIAFETSPGNGRFEALLLQGMTDKRWRVSGEIGRTNLYGNDSACMTDKRLKLYCYCLEGFKEESRGGNEEEKGEEGEEEEGDEDEQE